MKKTLLCFIPALFSLLAASGQFKPADRLKGDQHTVLAGAGIPLGEFSESHFAGISVAYAWSHHRFGYLYGKPAKRIGFIARGGAAYYFGKKTTTAGYDFTFGNYFYLHTFGGIIYNHGSKKTKQKTFFSRGDISVTAGPALGIYKGNANMGYGARLDGSYYFTARLALTPGVMVAKHALVNTLWSAELRGTYDF